MRHEVNLGKVRQIVGDMEGVRKRTLEEQVKARERESAEAERQKKEAEKRLRATGVVRLFEEISKKKIVVLTDPVYEVEKRGCLFGSRLVESRPGSPASVTIDNRLCYSPLSTVYGCYARISFNYRRDGYDTIENCVEAYLEGRVLIVQGEQRMVVGKDLNMSEAVGRALANPKVDRRSWPGD